mgnify:FL=1|jgi:hypothetical protein|tara:strand:- start:1279 stop:1767 length:489 start_codon:yes stop_codon:yes gene_type:complete
MGLDFELDLKYTSTLNEETGELTMNHEGSNKQIEEAAEHLMAVKSIECSAKEERIRAEQHLCELVGVRPEGATSFTSGQWMVRTVGKLYRKLDADAYEFLSADLPLAAHASVRTKLELNLSNLRDLQLSDPDAYGMLAQCITTTPGKPSVNVDFNMEEDHGD